jgi:predicted CopG family antitoxin
MVNTTIQISNEMKEKLSSFGSKSETFETILQRIYSLAVKEQLRDFLMNSKGFISIDQAIEEADKQWPLK